MDTLWRWRAALGLLLVGMINTEIQIGLWYPLQGIDAYPTTATVDEIGHLIGAVAALAEGVDWSRPLHLSGVLYPEGSSLLLTDSLPWFSLPMRIAWDAGVRFDPAVLFSLPLWVATMVIPASVYRLARVMGAGVGGGVIAAVGGTLLIGAIEPTLMHWRGMACWWMIPLLIAELMIIEREAGRVLRRRWSIVAALTGILWWSSIYLGAMATALVLSVILSLAARRSLPLRPVDAARSWGIALAASVVAPLSLIALGGIPPGYSAQSIGGLLLSLGPGIFTQLSGLDPSLVTNEWTYLQAWGPMALALAVWAIAASYRRAPGVIGASVVMALYSTGPMAGGGVVPDVLMTDTPIGIFQASWRLFLPAAIIGMAAAGARIDPYDRARRALRVSRRSTRSLIAPRALTAVLVGLVITAGWSAVAARSDDHKVLEPPYPASIASAERELLVDHQVLYTIPYWSCDRPSTGDAGPSEQDVLRMVPFRGLSNRLALVAAGAAVPFSSGYFPRLPARSCDQSPPPAALLFIHEAWPTPTGYFCAGADIPIYAAAGARICSERRSLLERFSDSAAQD